MKIRSRPQIRRILILFVPAGVVLSVALTAMATVPTTLLDYFQPGTQPGSLNVFMVQSTHCGFCHGSYDPNNATTPVDRWSTSMMAQAARDPIFHACLAIANQDAAFSGDLCIRCHVPVAWLEGRSTPTNGSAFQSKDFDGVNCHVCHRMVDPFYDAANNPPDDSGILAALEQAPTSPHTGQYVIDPNDRRRGPFDLDPNFPFHEWRRSPYHRESLLCGTCHEVSNPAFTRQPDGSYDLGPLQQPHPTHVQYDEFPLERTYSEWLMSSFAQGPVEMGGRFGGNITAVSSCQDCHMPKIYGIACEPGLGYNEYRNDYPLHDFNGANSWVLHAVRALYPDSQTGLTEDGVDASVARNIAMLQAASDLQLGQNGSLLTTRVINQTGHKLPTGYPEGRRMWVNVRFYDSGDALIDEYGAYNGADAILTSDDTTVYEAKLGIDADLAPLVGLPVGPSFHFALNNTYYKDNRIPPRGFTNAGFAAVQAAPVDHVYADGQYWDDTQYFIPSGARRADVRVFHQTTSREYIEFLRDANVTNSAGQVAYDAWVTHGKSAPVEMDYQSLVLGIPGDLDDDGDVDLADLTTLLAAFGINDDGDVNGNGTTELSDLTLLLSYFGTIG